MFVVYVGQHPHDAAVAAGRRRPGRGAGRASSSGCRSGCGSRCSSPTSPRRWPRAAARPRPPRLRKARRELAGQAADPPRPRTHGSRSSRPPSLRKGDVVLVEAGDIIPADGEVVEGVASVNESAITGESAPVIRESGGDRSSVTGGTQVLSDWLIVRGQRQPGRGVPGPDDRAGGGRQAAEDAQRDRPRHPAGGDDDHLPAGHRHPAALLALQRAGGRPGDARSRSPCWWRCSSA